MAYGIIRVRNLHAGDLSGTDAHNSRKSEQVQEHINSDKSNLNKYAYFGAENMKDAVYNIIEKNGIKTKKNSVLALEYVVALSGNPDEKKAIWDKPQNDPLAIFQTAKQWIAGRHGGNAHIASISIHLDESNPHAHIVVVPFTEKEVMWKNKNATGVKIERRLNAREHTGNKDLLIKLQDDFFKFIEPFGPHIGVKFYRGTKASLKLKEYVQDTNAEIGRLKALFQKTTDAYEKMKILKKTNDLGAQFEHEAKRLEKKIELNKNANKDEKWKKGKDFRIGF